MSLVSASHPHAPQVVGILGGMGPAAGADFVRLFVQACTDRMEEMGVLGGDARADTRPGAPQPADPMLQATGRLAALGARVVAIACNTAHAWHGILQQRFPQMVVLHG